MQSPTLQKRVVFYHFKAIWLQFFVPSGHVSGHWFALFAGFRAFYCDIFARHNKWILRLSLNISTQARFNSSINNLLTKNSKIPHRLRMMDRLSSCRLTLKPIPEALRHLTPRKRDRFKSKNREERNLKKLRTWF